MKKVTAVVDFWVDNGSAEDLQEKLINKAPLWIDEDFMSKFEVWDSVMKVDVKEVKIC